MDPPAPTKPIFAAALWAPSPYHRQHRRRERIHSRRIHAAPARGLRGPRAGGRCPSIPWRLGERGGQHGRDGADARGDARAQRHRRHAAPPRRRRAAEARRRPDGGWARGGVWPAGVARRALPRRPVAAGGARRRGAHRLPLGGASRRVPTLKYLLGRCGSTARRRRRRGRHAAHLCRRPPRLLFLLHGGGATPLDAQSRASRRPTRSPPPASTAARRGGARSGERRRAPAARCSRAGRAARQAEHRPDARLFSFLRASPACRRRKNRRRARGARAAGGAWLRGGGAGGAGSSARRRASSSRRL